MTRFDSPTEAIESNFKISTAHAIRKSGWAIQKWAKIFWIIIFVVVFVFFLFCITKLIQTYTEHLVTTAETRTSGEKPAFPSVTVCDLSLNTVDKVRKTVLYCSFDGYICNNTRDINIVDLGSKYGTCFTISVPTVGSDSGPQRGLELFLYAPKERYSINSELSGFRVTIHAPGTRPLIDSHGFLVSPGYELMVGAEWRVNKRLESNGCNAASKEDDGYLRSTQTCDHLQLASCKPSCTETYYNTELSVLKWPSHWHKNTVNRTMMSIVETLNYKPPNYETWLEDMSAVNVFFKDYHKTTITEDSAYTMRELLTHIGGVSALFIGFSFLTLFEAVDLIISIVVARGKNDDQRPLSG